MSRTIDERVVSMQFDNKQFENNVHTTLSTLDKLKKALKLEDASKGLEGINHAAKRCDLSSLGNSAHAVGLKFNAMYTIADQAFRNMYNSAEMYAKRIVSAFTTQPIKTGFQEYETQINAIQTILANTESKGTTLNHVTQALDTLNTYADKTIYNFTEMTRNIGTFTAAGVELETAVNSIQGIANLAAVSGSTSQQASTAMYQLSQALASGTVKLMDWNSVVNAGMGGQVFQDALKDTARVHGIAIDQMIANEGSFRETLKEGWITSEILTETLEKFTSTTEGLTEEQIEANRQMWKARGYTDDQIDGIFKLGKTATDAATKVKTFTQLWDTLKESAQSGWTQTWELIVGDFGEAKELWTGVSDVIGEMIGKSADRRNTLLEGALTNNYDKLIKKINEAGIETTDFEKKLRSVLEGDGYNVDKFLEKYGTFEKIFTSGAISAYKLQEALNGIGKSIFDISGVEGIFKRGSRNESVSKIQEAIKALGGDLGKYGVDGIYGPVTEAAVRAFQEANGLTVDGIVGPETLAALEKAGAGTQNMVEGVEDLINGVTTLGGRELLIESLKNAFTALMTPLTAIGNAWREVFTPMSSEQLYGIIEKIHAFSEKLIMSDETAGKVQSTFRGLFAVLDLLKTVVGGGLGVAFKLVSALLANFDLNLLDVAASAGDALVKFRDWAFENNVIAKGFDGLVGWITRGAVAIKDWVSGFINLEKVQTIASSFKASFMTTFGGVIGKIKEFLNLVKNIGKVTLLKDAFGNLKPKKVDFKTIIDFFKTDLLGEFQKISFGTFFDNAINSLTQFRDAATEHFEAAGIKFDEIRTKISNFVTTVKNTLGKNMGSILAIGVLITFVVLMKKIKDAVETLAKPFDALDDFLGGLKNTLKDFGKAAKANALKNIAVAIAILAGSVAVLAMLGWKKVLPAVGVIVALGAGLVIMAKSISKIDAKDFTKLSAIALSLSAALLILAIVAKIIGGMDTDALLKGGAAIAAFLLMMAMVAKTTTGMDMWVGEFGKMMLKLSVALLAMAVVVKMFGSMEDDVLFKGVATITYFLALMEGMMASTQMLANDIPKFGSMMLGLGAALLLMAVAVSIFGKMKTDTLIKGGIAVTAFILIIKGLMKATIDIGANNVGKFGAMMLGIGAALLLMSASVAILGNLDLGTLVKGELAIAGMMGMIVLLMKATQILGKYSFNAGKVGAMMVGVSTAILMMSGAILLLSLIDAGGLARATAAVAVMGVIFGALLALTKFAKNIKVGTIMALSASVAILAASVAALSFIEPSKLKGATTALSVVVGVFALLAASTKFINTKSMLAIGVMTAAVAGLAFIIYKLSDIPAKKAESVADALSKVILSFSASCVLLGVIGLIGPAALWGVAVLAALLAVLGAALAIGINALPKIGEKLSKFAEEVAPFVSAMEGITPELQAGMQVLADTIMSFVKAGVIDTLTGGKSLSNFSSQFEDFAKGLADFSDVVSKESFDANAIRDAADAASALAKVANSIPDNTGAWLTKFFFGGKDLGKFGTQVSDFGTGLAAFSDSVTGATFDVDAVNDAADVASALADVANKIPDNTGIWTKLIGTKDLGEFGNQAGNLGAGLADFSDAVAGKEFDTESVDGAMAVAKALADVASTIPDSSWVDKLFGSDLSTFSTDIGYLGGGLVTFSNAITTGNFDKDKASKAADVASALAKVGSEIPETGWMSRLCGNASDLAVFSTDIGYLGAGLVSFCNAIVDGNFDPSKATKAVNVAAALGEAAASVPENGWMTRLCGNASDLLVFSTDIGYLGAGLVSFCNAIVDGEFNPDKATKAVNVAAALGTAAASVPENGWITRLCGQASDLSIFATDIGYLGSGLVSFCNSIVDGNFDPDKATKAVSVVSALATAANDVPDSSWVDKLLGSDLSSFSTDLGYLGGGLVAFSNAITEGNFDKDKATAAADVVSALASATENIPDTNWADKLFGSDLDTFASDAASLGAGIAAFSKAISDGGFDSSVATPAAAVVDSIVAIADKLNGEDANAWYLPEYGDKIVEFGTDLNTFAGDISGIDTTNLTTISTSLDTVVTAAKNMTDLSFNTEGIASFIASLGNVGTDGVEALIAALTNGHDRALEAGENLINKIVAGIKSDTAAEDMSSGIKTLVSGAINEVGNYNDDFVTAGSNFGLGLANGIENTKVFAVLKAGAVAKAMLNKIKDVFDTASPSKETYKIGEYVGEGLVLGVNSYQKASEKAGAAIAESTKTGLSTAISKVRSLIETGIDAQPTIRPVLDLSGVEAGAGAISGMLGTPSVRTMANIGAISSMMKTGQNGMSNADVVSAIKDLGNKLGDISGDTYTFGNVTYGSDSEISGAVQTLVRAAKMERRT